MDTLWKCAARTWMTTMLPTAAAACAARGDGGSPSGAYLSHLPLRTSKMCTSFVAPARRMPTQKGSALQKSEDDTPRHGKSTACCGQEQALLVAGKSRVPKRVLVYQDCHLKLQGLVWLEECPPSRIPPAQWLHLHERDRLIRILRVSCASAENVTPMDRGLPNRISRAFDRSPSGPATDVSV